MLLCVCVCVCVYAHAHTLSSISLQAHGWQPTRLLCLGNFPGKNTGVGCHLILQGILPTQESHLCLLHWQADSLPRHHEGGSLPGCRQLPSCHVLSRWRERKSFQNSLMSILRRALILPGQGPTLQPYLTLIISL